jgi:magnesium transporter
VHVLTAADRDEIAGLRDRGEFFWLDLVGPDASGVRALGDVLGLDPIVVDELGEHGRRPKLEGYGDYLLIVFYAARTTGDGRPAMSEVALVVHPDYLVSVRDDPCAELSDLHRQFAAWHVEREDVVVYRVLDTLTDTFFPVLSAIDDEIDQLEDDVIGEPTDEQLGRISRLKRDLVRMRKVVTPQRDLLARAGDDVGQALGLQPGGRDPLRDVYDRLIRISDLIDSYRDLLTGAMDVYLSTVSNRLNLVMKRLTVVATVFLPLTFLTGFFGQNFGWMVERVNTLAAFLVLGVGSLVASCVGLALWFRRGGLG